MSLNSLHYGKIPAESGHLLRVICPPASDVIGASRVIHCHSLSLIDDLPIVLM